MASIYDRNGTFYAQFYDADRTPTRKRFSLQTTDRQTANRRLRRLEQSGFDPWTGTEPRAVWTDDSRGEESGDSRSLKSPTLTAAIEQFTERKRRQGRAESTLRKYRDVWRLLCKRVGEDTPLKALTARHLRRFVYDPDIKRTTQAARYRHATAVLRWFDRDGVADAVEKPRTGRKLPKAIRERELRSICEATVKDYRRKRRNGHCRPREIVWCVPAFRLAYLTGLRGSELGRLRWSHVDLERGRLYIYEQKSGNEDTVPLVSDARTLLRRLYGGESGATFVVRSPQSPHRERSATRFREHLSRKFAEYRDAAGVRPSVTLHSLRHGFATRLAENGASAVAIKNALRHASIQTSMRYVEMAGSRVAEEMEAAFS
jgi:integrase